MAAPTVTSVTPATDDYLGGAAVLITGTNFTGATAVLFGTTSTTDFTIVSATSIVVTAPAHDAGEVSVEVTNADGTSENEVAFTYTGTAVMFSIAEARAFDKAQLTSATTFSNNTISAKEIAIRARFERLIGVRLTPTTHTEYYDGDGTDTLVLLHHNPWAEATPRPVTLTSVTVIATDDTETDFTATELSNIVKYPDRLVRRSGVFTSGHRNIKVVYQTGYVTCPEDLKKAALQVLVLPQPDGLMPSAVSSYSTEGMDGQVNWMRTKDPDRGRWFGNELADGPIREHRYLEMLPGIA
jgi:hypothetical protein